QSLALLRSHAWRSSRTVLGDERRATALDASTHHAPSRTCTQGTQHVAPEIQRAIIAAAQRRLCLLLVGDVVSLGADDGPRRCGLGKGGKENIGGLEIQTTPDAPGDNRRSHDCTSVVRLWSGPSLVLVTPAAARSW